MLHRNMPLGDGHIIHNWEVANAAARTALVVTAADKGKLAWQLDTNVFWFLSNDVGPVWIEAVGRIGTAGLSILSGAVAPVGGTGVNGEFYINTATSMIYGPKAAGTWPAGVSLVGAAGTTGTTGTAGTNGTNGINGTNGTNGTNAPKVLPVACSDEVTALTAGVAKVTFRMPYAMTVSAVKASLTTAQATGASLLTVDINEAGVSILSTKLTFDNTEKTTTTAVTAAVISDSALADDAEITIDIDLVGDGTAKGLKVYLIGT